MSLRFIPAGALVKRTYYAVPDYSGVGTEFETWEDAVTHALKRRQKHINLGASDGAADIQCVVDLRWDIEYEGGSADMPVERTNVASLQERYQRLGRLN